MAGKAKYIALAVLIVLGALIVYFTINNNQNQQDAKAGKELSIDPEFAAYISSFTSGFVSSHSSVRIRLAREMAGSTQLNTPLNETYFSFDPSIKGKTVWRDAQTIEFIPDEPLKNGQTYQTTFYLGKLVDVKDELEEFVFRFQTIEQSIDLSCNDLKSYHLNDYAYYSLSGRVSTADMADATLLESTLMASYNNKLLPVKWTHDESGTTHHFLIDSIERPATHASTITISCDGSRLGLESKQKQDFSVPEKGKFLLFNAKLVAGNDPYVLINFSNPVDQDKSLEGLITMQGLSELKYIVNQNQVMLYPGSVKSGAYILKINAGVSDSKGQRLGYDSEHSIVFSEANPAVRFSGEGNILPSTNGLSIPFESVNLRAVDVSVVKIYENNVLQFLQNNQLDGSYQLAQVGRQVIRKRMPLGLNSPADLNTWKKFSLDMSTFFEAERGAIYRVTLSFKKSYSAFPCLGNDLSKELEMEEVQTEEEEVSYFNYYNEYDDYEAYGDEEEYNWRERDDPCKSSYYARSSRSVTKNILASDIGLTIKKGNDGSFFVVTSDLVSAKPMQGVDIEFYDYQKQLIQKENTDGQGQVFVSPVRMPSFIVAKKDKQFAYMRLDEGETLPLSLYDVSGAAIKKGVKGFIYGERGVWRPGDTLFLNFILEDKLNTLPAGHPVSFTLFNPQGQVYKRFTSTQEQKGFYNFSVATDLNAPTGMWTAEVKVGPVKFNKGVRIESIMPNRLKIKLAMPDEKVLYPSPDQVIQLQTAWLTGATAKELPVKMSVALSAVKTEFPKFKDYVFDDNTLTFEAQQLSLFDGKTDETGKVKIPLKIEIKENAPGMLKAAFNTMVFEPGGSFSVDRYNMLYSPYKIYAGIKLPSGEKNSGILYTERDQTIEIATVDASGKPVSRSNLKFELYKLEWRWWWDQYQGELANYANDEYHKPVQVQNISSSNGKASVKVRIADNNWGRYLIRVIDLDGGHASSVVTYFDWANWMDRGGNNGDSKIVANMLNFSTNKTNYASGEESTVFFPTPRNGRALITIENGSRVLEAHWLETEGGNSSFKFKITPQMAPNVYVHVSLIQPHSRSNDLPIRLYGVVPVTVDDAATHLKPTIKMPDVLEPEKQVNISVAEESGREMAFTLAVVDEGLLDLTRFKTPDPHQTFYAKEALGVKTWDVFDQVIGAFGADLERVLSIGGDGSEINNDAAKANRFKPMVRFFGPYQLAKGEKKNIAFKMPMYVGSVRTMVIAGNKGAYGTAEKTTPVKAPLMILGTLPRVLSVGEEVKLPVSVFGGEKNIGKTELRIELSGPVQAVGSNVRTITVGRNEESLALFDLRVKDNAGIARIKIHASGGGHTATYEMELDVRHPNPYETLGKNYVLEAGKTLNENFTPVGVAGTNSGMIELSTIPPLNMEERLRYLVSYPHGCIEQTSSGAFAQLYLADLMELNNEMKSDVENNVKAGINALRRFQLSSGAFAYWPGNTEPSDWGTSYAGHFFLSSEKKGYSIPGNIKRDWLNYQKNTAQNFVPDRNKNSSSAELQAYRLYVLSLAGNPLIGAMNRLREYTPLSAQARWLLAGAYAQAGQTDEATKLINNTAVQPERYRVNYETYGSTERDMAIVLQVLTLMNKKQEAYVQLKKVSEFLSSKNWLSTQTTAFGLVAVSDFVRRFGISSALQAECKVNGRSMNLKEGKALTQVPVDFKGSGSGNFMVANNGKGPLFVRFVNRGKPPIGSETAGNGNIEASVVYKDLSGNIIDPAVLEQGTNVMISVTVRNLGLQGPIKNIALSQYIPSGWEIHNARMDDNEAALKSSAFTYQDIRDDKVFTYFDLFTNETKTFNLLVNASYEGRYYLPGLNVEAMYDNTVFARSKGMWVNVKKGNTKTAK